MNYGLHTSEELAPFNKVIMLHQGEKELKATVIIKSLDDTYAAKCFLLAQEPTINEFYISSNDEDKTFTVEGYRRYAIYIYKKVNN